MKNSEILKNNDKTKEHSGDWMASRTVGFSKQ
jgi:hypothetical protein